MVNETNEFDEMPPHENQAAPQNSANKVCIILLKKLFHELKKKIKILGTGNFAYFI